MDTKIRKKTENYECISRLSRKDLVADDKHKTKQGSSFRFNICDDLKCCSHRQSEVYCFGLAHSNPTHPC